MHEAVSEPPFHRQRNWNEVVERTQGLVGWGFEQPGLVEGVPVRGRGGGTRWSLRSLPTQTILWLFYCQTGNKFLPLLIACCHSSLQVNNHMSRVLTDGSKWEGCNKWRDVGKVGILIIDWDWSLQSTWLEEASEQGLLYISVKPRGLPAIKDHRDTAAELHLS